MLGKFSHTVIRITAALLLVLAVAGCPSERHTLLCDTDYEAVLKACREVLDNASAWGLEVGGKYNIRWTPRSPLASRFPKAILDLAPVQARIQYEGCLILEMHGGFDHFGFIVYSKSFREPYPGFEYEGREIIEGLWYHDDDYRDEFPIYKKKIDAWIEKGKKKAQ